MSSTSVLCVVTGSGAFKARIVITNLTDTWRFDPCAVIQDKAPEFRDVDLPRQSWFPAEAESPCLAVKLPGLIGAEPRAFDPQMFKCAKQYNTKHSAPQRARITHAVGKNHGGRCVPWRHAGSCVARKVGATHAEP